MSFKISGKATIFKDEKGVCRVSVSNNELQENGEEKTIFMRINVGFKKGVEIKNRTKINVTDGFITFFRIPTGMTTEDGQPMYRKYPKLMIMDFEIIEDGIEEDLNSGNYYNDTSDNYGNTYLDDSFSINDDLPF